LSLALQRSGHGGRAGLRGGVEDGRFLRDVPFAKQTPADGGGLSRWRHVPGCSKQGDLVWMEDSAGGTPTDAVGTTALPEKLPVWGGLGQRK